MEEATDVPSSSIASGVSSKGRLLEYLFTALNLVLHPRDMLPPSYFPSLSRKSIVIVVPKSKTVHPLPLKRYLAAMMEAALSGVRYGGSPYSLTVSIFLESIKIKVSHSPSRI